MTTWTTLRDIRTRIKFRLKGGKKSDPKQVAHSLATEMGTHDPYEMLIAMGVRIYTRKQLFPSVRGVMMKRVGYSPELTLNEHNSAHESRQTCSRLLGKLIYMCEYGNVERFDLIDYKYPHSGWNLANERDQYAILFTEALNNYRFPRPLR